jgi:DNA-binding NarL/FixJ family response regulator
MSEAPDGTRIVVADRASVVRAGVIRVLSSVGYAVVAEAATGAETLELVHRLAPEVVVAESRLPDVDIPQLCTAVLRANQQAGVVVFSDPHEGLIDALAAGARAIVTKKASQEVLIAAVRAVAEGASYVDPALATAAWLAAAPSNRKEISPAGLTMQELRVLALLPKGLTNEQIAAELLVSRDTVKTHVANIQRKLRLHNRTEAAVAALRLGLG